MNWGLAAVVYAVIGAVIARVLASAGAGSYFWRRRRPVSAP